MGKGSASRTRHWIRDYQGLSTVYFWNIVQFALGPRSLCLNKAIFKYDNASTIEPDLEQPLKYLSTRNTEKTVGFKTALLAGLAPEGGLYVPTEWPQVSIGKAEILQSYSKNAATLMQPFLSTDIPKAVLNKITEDAYAGFAHDEVAPLVEISENHWL